MYSVNVPVPSTVAALAGDLASDLTRARTRRRGTHTLVAKRLPGDQPYAQVEARAREVLRGTPAFEARIDGLGVFETAVIGPSPVVYLHVESPGLRDLHARLVEAFEPVPDFEGDDYTPHVTVARGGDPEAAYALAERSVESYEWVVDELAFWDAERDRTISRVSLPA
ncbi:2'-5' RNA ligase family protein [Halorientalis marina]|uniref:2'-5' RNA ligase family protein n=1 Tax=Halorientalis marina TaxID=2931976 RepID=UPI001FF57152|nr:2'-5' RNA ligase family protein [Halorientalis marina]